VDSGVGRREGSKKRPGWRAVQDPGGIKEKVGSSADQEQTILGEDLCSSARSSSERR
jgi:hypothetical protein